MKKVLLFLLMLALLTACAPKQPPLPPPADKPSPDIPEGYLPNPADSAFKRESLFLDVKGLSTLESSPVQFMLLLQGNLPTPCHKLRIAVSPPDANNNINVDVYTLTDPALACIQSLEPFEVSFSLGSYPTGLYTVILNGEVLATIQS